VSEWHDVNNYPQVCAWQADRSHIVNNRGVGDVVTLHLQDGRNGEITTIVIPTDIAIKLGWDLIGEGGNFFAQGFNTTIISEDFD
jgi:hypothetical protein